MRKVYAVLTGLLLAAVVVQFYLAAVGAFSKPQADNSYILHDINGTLVIPVLTILATIAAAVLRLPRRQIGMTLLPLGLVVVQVLIVLVGEALDKGSVTTPASVIVLGLHAVNGLAIMAVSGTLFARARRLAVSTAPAASTVDA
jgi:hypothetical protein